MSAEIKPSVRNALGVLRNGPFRRYIIGSAISDTGTWMQVMAQGWVMATLTSSALMLGLVNLCAGLPMLLLTMVGGAAADRFDQRLRNSIRVFRKCDFVRGVDHRDSFAAATSQRHS